MGLTRLLFRRKTLEQLASEADDHEGPKLNRVLTARDVFNAGVAAIIGTGIFVLTGVAASTYAGPGIILSFVLSGIACAFVSFSYAELASMIPIAGSAYTYAYATLGEVIAWIIGWDLLLEYSVGNSAVAVGWSAYLQNICRSLGFQLPEALAHAPATMPWSSVFMAVALMVVALVGFRKAKAKFRAGNGCLCGGTFVWFIASAAMFVVGLVKAFDVVQHINSVDLPAIVIITALNFMLVKGVKHTARLTSVFVVIKLAVIALFIVLGITHIHPVNYHPFLPFGWHGVLTGAAIVFFAYIGFDAVTTMSEECKNPQRDVPRGVVGSLVVCTVLYLIVAAIMTGVMSYTKLGGTEAAAPMARVLSFLGYWWASPLVSVGAIAGITSVLVVLLYSQSRILMRMSRDGLISPSFGQVHPKHRTPTWSILVTGTVVALMAGLLPISELAELSNIGTLAAFVLVCIGVIVLRKKEPERPRKFRCPGMPWVPSLGAVMSFVLMLGLPMLTWIRFVVWMVIGLLIYWRYGSRHSTLNQSGSSSPADKASP